MPFDDVMEVVRKQPDLMARLMEVFCQALKEAYSQVNALAADDLVHRLVNVLRKRMAETRNIRLAQRHRKGKPKAV